MGGVMFMFILELLVMFLDVCLIYFVCDGCDVVILMCEYIGFCVVMVMMII